MADTYNTKYKEKSSDYTNPSDDQDPAEKVKDKAFFRRKAEWLYSQYLNDRCYIPFSKISKFRECRLYAQGRQSTSKYLDLLQPKSVIPNRQTGNDGPGSSNQWERKGYMNISWDIESPMPKFRAKVVGLLHKVDFNATATCVDEHSDYQRNMMKFRRMAILKEKDFIEDIKAVSGVEPTVDDPAQQLPFEPSNIQEMDMIDKMGGFKLWQEVVMQKLVKWSYDLSDWDETHKRILEDIFDIAYCGTKDYTDKMTQRAKVRYVDPEFFVGREDRKNDFPDMSEAGEIVFYSIQTLRETGEFTDLELRDLSNTYQGQLGNPRLNSWMGNTPITDHSRYMAFKIPVLDFEFESTDTKLHQLREVDGKTVPFRSTIKKQRKDEKYATSKRKRFYRCKWIIGTELIYDYGYQNDVPYHNDDEPRSSYSMYRVQDRSMTDLCIASLDSLQMSVLNYRNAKSKAAPSGISVEFGTLSGMSLGGGTMLPMDILRIRRETGDLIYKASVDQGGRVLQGTTDPVKPIVGGIGPYLTELMTCFTYELNTIREITGLNAIVDASAPTSESQVGTAQIAQAATNDVLRPSLMAYKNLKKRSARNMASRWQVIVAAAKDPVKAYLTAIGGTYSDIVTIGKEFSLPTYGITFDATVDDQMIMDINQKAGESMAQGKNGQPGLTLSQYFAVRRMLERGEVLLAQLYLSYCEAKSKEEMDARARQMQQENGQNAIALEQQKGQTLQMELAAKSSIMDKEIQGRQLELKTEYSLKAELVKLEAAAKANVELALVHAKAKEERATLEFQMVKAKELGVEVKGEAIA